MLDTIEKDGLLDNATTVGELLRDGLAHDPRVTEVRGEGLLIGLDLDADRRPTWSQAAQDAGFILNACTPDRIRLAPPLVLTERAGRRVPGRVAGDPGRPPTRGDEP